ncbi:MAG TPA: heme ABC exporter ATP-binding protein CcmA [Verrucomicrobiae bacterium]|nr:heme ABC exporter ATP-binding protein CcmA [Verrucomicrobiae bacterium]
MTPPAFSPVGLRFENIDKRYGGLLALRAVSLTINAGECLVFAGRNGSGKTTLLRIAAKLVRPSRGTVNFSGESSGEKATAMRPGFVAHATMVYDELTAEENLLLFAQLQNVAQPGKRVEALLEEVGLTDRRASLVRTFSRGMRQRVAIARALLHEPSILLFDEPATGLDPQGVAWLAEAIRRLRDSGRTILMSLHGESEISSLGTRAIRLDAGSIAADTRTGATFRSILTFADA